MGLSEVMDEFCEQEKIGNNEGLTGVKNLCRLVRAMGYKDSMHFGQFDQNGAYGDLIEFLEDNSGCVEAIKEWIANQNADEWKENLESQLPQLCDKCEEPLKFFMKDDGTNYGEVFGCADCDS